MSLRSLVSIAAMKRTIFDIINRDDFIVLVDKAMLVCEGFAFHTYYAGEMMEHRLELYTKAGKELNYI